MDLRSLRKKLIPQRLGVASRRRWRDLTLSWVGLERSYKPRALVRSPELLASSIVQYLIAHELQSTPDFCFMQIGAYDGAGDDDLREPVLRLGLRGTLVEPQPAAFERLKTTYAGQPQVKLLNAAIADTEGTRTLYCPRSGDAQTASFNRQHLIRHGIRREEILGRSVPCYTVEGALAVAGLERVDLLQTDTEGYDYQLLQSIDFQRLRPAIIRFEYRHMSGREVNASVEMLAQLGYRFFLEPKDLVAYRPRRVASAAAA